MEHALKESLWNQFGASIDMLENAIRECPDKVWDSSSQFWYKAYHTLFFLDYYLTTEPEKFLPPPPFTLSEFDPSGKLPDRTYSREELISYLIHCRNKCYDLIASLTTDIAEKRWINTYRNYSIFEILIYNMRHVQHHAGQLYLLLRQRIDNAPRWVSQTKTSL